MTVQGYISGRSSTANVAIESFEDWGSNETFDDGPGRFLSTAPALAVIAVAAFAALVFLG